MQRVVRQAQRAGAVSGAWRALMGRPRTLAAAAALLALALSALAAPAPQYRAEARVFVAAPATPAPLEQAAALARSREFARAALDALGGWDRAEFAASSSIAARALDALGFGDPDRDGGRERALAAFERRLVVAAAPAERQIAIAFKAADPGFAAAAANKIAALFVEAGAAAAREDEGAAAAYGLSSVMAPATPPLAALSPDPGLMLALAAALALAAFAIGATSRARRRGAQAAPAAPRPVDDARLEMGGFVSARLGGAPVFPVPDRALALEDAAARILAARAAGPTRIFCAALGAPAGPSVIAGADALVLARRLSAEGRSILIDLGDLSDGAPAQDSRPGLVELLAREASFDEAIRRDACSRLHLVGRGAGASADALTLGAELPAILDALAGAYDFIWLSASCGAQDEGFEALAAQADVVALFAAPDAPRFVAPAPSGAAWRARDVLVIGAARGVALRGFSLGAA